MIRRMFSKDLCKRHRLQSSKYGCVGTSQDAPVLIMAGDLMAWTGVGIGVVEKQPHSADFFKVEKTELDVVDKKQVLRMSIKFLV